MTRRIVRTIVQVSALAILTFIVVFFLDRNFRVLPSAIHEYMPQHHAGLLVTDITIKQCSSLNVFSSCRLDPDIWHRIEKDLYLGRTLVTSAYVHVKRKKEEELTPEDKVVIDVKVGRLDPGTGVKGEADERWEARDAGLWIKRSAKKKAIDSKQTITAVDVLFGDDAVEARDGWEMAEKGTPLMLDAGAHVPSAHITVRRGSQQEPYKPELKIKDNGKFKIMQVSDMHLSTGVGVCRDEMPEHPDGEKCEADPRTLDFITRVMEDERPDLIVLGGDQINGDTAPDAQSAIFKYAQLFIKHKIPYISIFGNHDDEKAAGKSLSRANQMALVETLPYSLSKSGPDDIDGVGNYYIEILAKGTSKHSAVTVYMMDTHSYSPDERRFKGYDWIKKNQIDWFRQTAQGLKKKHNEYTHIHLDVAFIHIPLPEYRAEDQVVVGDWKEGVTAPTYNSGFRDALVEQGVVMVSCGHDHANEYCALSTDETKKPALWMCYAGGSGFGGYGGYGGFHRKIRLFDIDTNEARITTWKRVEWGETKQRLDEQIIVDAGKPIAPMQG